MKDTTTRSAATTLKRHLALVISMAWVTTTTLGTVNDQPGSELSALPEDARGALQKFAAAMGTAYLESEEALTGQDAPKYYGGPTKCYTFLDGKRFYLKTEVHYKDQAKPSVHEDSFDGTHFYYADLSDADEPSFNNGSMLKKYLPSSLSDKERQTPLYFRYLSYVGVSVPEAISDSMTFESAGSQVLQLLDTSTRTSIRQIENWLHISVTVPDPVILRARKIDLEARKQELASTSTSPAFIESYIGKLKALSEMPPERLVNLVLDQKLGYGLVERKDYTYGGKLISTMDTDGWRQDPALGVWLPEECTIHYYTGRFDYAGFTDQPRLAVTATLTSLAGAPPGDIFFTLEDAPAYSRPGTEIYDRASELAQANPNHQVNYFVGVDGERLRTSALRLDVDTGKPSSWFLVWLIVLGILPGLILVRLLLNRSSNSKS